MKEVRVGVYDARDGSGVWFCMPYGKSVCYEVVTGPGSMSESAKAPLLSFAMGAYFLVPGSQMKGRVVVSRESGWHVVDVDKTSEADGSLVGPVIRGNVLINDKIQVVFDVDSEEGLDTAVITLRA